MVAELCVQLPHGDEFGERAAPASGEGFPFGRLPGENNREETGGQNDREVEGDGLRRRRRAAFGKDPDDVEMHEGDRSPEDWDRDERFSEFRRGKVNLARASVQPTPRSRQHQKENYLRARGGRPIVDPPLIERIVTLVGKDDSHHDQRKQIGRASCRDRV